ncbi:hypothetical protein C8R45DRAFT_1212786 [Mycena sanguinolenta]|nr:hypothetical protein C8R45DRAFT_1212786 [Mycena sanguinolenta]
MFHKRHLALFFFLQTLAPTISAGVIASASRTNQTIRWVDCNNKSNLPRSAAFQPPRGEMDVPMDYTQPFNAITNNITIGFAMTRPAQTASGLILYHAGGPGENAAAVIWASALNLSDVSEGLEAGVFEGLEDFDILASSTTHPMFLCESSVAPHITPPNNIDSPSTQAEFDQYTAAMKNFYEAAIRDSTLPGIMQYVGTTVIQDWDSMRAALGYEKVSFAGISYGTFAGMSYAARYPERVDRFVLDAVLPHGMAWETVLAKSIQAPLPALSCGPGIGCNSPVTPSDLRQGANALLSTIPDFPLFSIVYYRVYASYGAIPSKRAPDSTQPFIGRIKATSVPPPLKVASLKRTLAHAEGIPDPFGERSELYHYFLGVETPMADTDTVAILGLGASFAATPTDAVALVFVDELSEEEESNLPKIEEEKARVLGAGTKDLYYRLHTRSGEDHSTRAFDPEVPALGCIDLSTIAPPRDARAIKHCIAKTERKPIYKVAHLYADVSEELPLSNEASISTAEGNFRGSSAADALRLVQPERRPGVHNRPVRVIHQQYERMPPSRWRSSSMFWLEARPGDIMATDGIVHQNGGELVYTVVNATGVEGWIKAENVKFLDE